MRSTAPTIREAMRGYVAALPARRRREARLGLELLESSLDMYAHDSLPATEAERFDRSYNAEGREHREYCELFGPDKIVPELRLYFGWFLIRKVMARAEELEATVRETESFLEWLRVAGHVTANAAAEGLTLAAQAVRVVRRAEEACHLSYEHLEARQQRATGQVLEGHFRVTRLERGKVWLESDEEGREFGPFAVPVAVTERLAAGWEVSGAIGRAGRKWVLLEVWNVYPEVG